MWAWMILYLFGRRMKPLENRCAWSPATHARSRQPGPALLSTTIVRRGDQPVPCQASLALSTYYLSIYSNMQHRVTHILVQYGAAALSLSIGHKGRAQDPKKRSWWAMCLHSPSSPCRATA